MYICIYVYMYTYIPSRLDILLEKTVISQFWPHNPTNVITQMTFNTNNYEVNYAHLATDTQGLPPGLFLCFGISNHHQSIGNLSTKSETIAQLLSMWIAPPLWFLTINIYLEKHSHLELQEGILSQFSTAHLLIECFILPQFFMIIVLLLLQIILSIASSRGKYQHRYVSELPLFGCICPGIEHFDGKVHPFNPYYHMPFQFS